MRHRMLAVTLILTLWGCDDGPARDGDTGTAVTATGTVESAPSIRDPARMTLRLPRPGTPRAVVLEEFPLCAEHLEGVGGLRCRFHGKIEPLASACEDGCTWWTYQFANGDLDVAQLERAEWDVDSERVETLTEQALEVSRELTRTLSVTHEVEHVATWTDVESSQEHRRVVLERRTWQTEGQLTTWTTSVGTGHHPCFILDVRVEELRPETLRVEALNPGLQTGAPLLRLRGGPVPRPFDVPLWLTFDRRDRDHTGACAVSHETVVFPLADGRVYVGQYNPQCGSPRTCRLVDPTTGASEAPAGGCLWGEGIHHRVEVIEGEHLLLTSDAEGVGAVRIVRYHPARGAEVELHLAFGPYASPGAEVRDGGVDFSTPCELPAGCESRDYGAEPPRSYRWSPGSGLVSL